MNKMHKKACTALNYIEHLLILASVFTECVSISPLASFIGILIDIASSGIGLKDFTVTAGIKKCKSIIKKERKKYDKIVLLAKTNEKLIS